MRVRVLKDFQAGDKTFRAGEVMEMNSMIACVLLRAELVMQDKSLDGAKETKEK